MIKNILLTIQYDGTRYSGWQKQGNTENTIQGKLESILTKLCSSPVEIHGAGRTDAGVHALCQQANFHIETTLTSTQIMDYINQFLPSDIGVISAQEVPHRFHSRLNAIKKTYRYIIQTGNAPDVFYEKFSYRHIEPLIIENMIQSSKYLLGTHDFKSFTDLKKTKKSTVREIENIKIYKDENRIILDITATGFLYHMARIIAGTLIKVGEGEIAPEDIIEILESKQRTLSGPLAPSKGLMLMKVYYQDISQI